jgi:UDP-N-acetylglucosamine 1-carboxyvinyltransferase
MIEIGSFIALAATTQSEITIKNVQFKELGIIPDVFRKLGIQFSLNGDDLYIPSQQEYMVNIYQH